MPTSSGMPLQTKGFWGAWDEAQKNKSNLLDALMKRAYEQSQINTNAGNLKLAQEFQPTRINQAQAQADFHNAETQAMPTKLAHLWEMIKASQLHTDPSVIKQMASGLGQDPTNPQDVAQWNNLFGTKLNELPQNKTKQATEQAQGVGQVQQDVKTADKIATDWAKIEPYQKDFEIIYGLSKKYPQLTGPGNQKLLDLNLLNSEELGALDSASKHLAGFEAKELSERGGAAVNQMAQAFKTGVNQGGKTNLGRLYQMMENFKGVKEAYEKQWKNLGINQDREFPGQLSPIFEEYLGEGKEASPLKKIINERGIPGQKTGSNKKNPDEIITYVDDNNVEHKIKRSAAEALIAKARK